jgi:alpha-D-glucose phosphate-specific phosphoglucomutase
MPPAIHFGTSGWRGIMAEDMTFATVRLALSGIARYVASQKKDDAVLLVARDPRFLGESFVALATEVLTAHGITARVIREPAPTPAVAHEVVRSRAQGAINFTASHNPPEYNGIKFSTPDGAPALPEVTGKIEAEIAALGEAGGEVRARGPRGRVEACDPRPAYLKRLVEIVDLKAIRKSGLRVAFDPLWGAARGYTDALLREHGVEVATLHDFRDVLFGGHAPEPDEPRLRELHSTMREAGAGIGVATDGDADRFGILDRDGSLVQPNYVIALLFEYLVETRGWRNGVAKSVATTNLINALAEDLGIPLYETPVGFKYIGKLIGEDKIAIGGEESAGLTIRHHVPEKDGILAGLLCCEMMAVRGLSLAEQLHKIFAKVGSFYPMRENFRLTPEVKEKFTDKLNADPSELDGRRVAKVVRTDGLKLVFEDGAWVCYRLSGTEPVVRVYSEARTKQDLERLSSAAREWVLH